ncbi:zinc-binding dehydrogenase [Pseudomonas sp. KCA11]|nr:zinc-binding dehydrogenase [Pseudomonas sp. KCA11]
MQVGDRVAYAMGPVGGYASGRLYPAERLVKLTPQLDEQAAAAVLAAVAEGIIQPRVWRRYPLAEAARVHGDLEQGLSEGALVLTA